jgi:4-amino-4-deoxy-L-arabinose transferase-like glycosyltransferase
MSRRLFIACLVMLMTVGAAARLVWLRADPPVEGSVGVIWHDEGAWIHNARNKVLWDTWRTDAWNPVFVAPVFTALEYAALSTFGVGTWQARLVPAVSGIVAVGLMVFGLHALAGRRAAIIGGALLSANYAFIMWNRAALMESTMTALLVAAWAAYTMADKKPVWGVVAGVAAAAAWFTKAAAAFLVAALVLDAIWMVGRPYWQRRHTRSTTEQERRIGLYVIAGLGISFVLVAVAFVWPHWTDYRFYNWQMSVARKPGYSLSDLATRASWLPLVPSIFSRMWLELVCAACGALGIVARWRSARPGERLLVLWVIIGLAELVVHDSGNERRYVMFIPAVIALAALAADRWLGRPRPSAIWESRMLPAVLGLVLVMGYLVAGSLVRPLFLAQIEAGDFKMAARLSAFIAVALAAGVYVWRARVCAWLVAPRVPHAALAAILVLALGGQVWQYVRWVPRRTMVNYEASVALGRILPEGTVVQGKLANGLSLENRIRPLFVGNGFGNYDDRLRREDARYILTYDLPSVGFESQRESGLIQGILDHYPRQRVIATFVVDETLVADRAALIDKFPNDAGPHARD